MTEKHLTRKHDDSDSMASAKTLKRAAERFMHDADAEAKTEGVDSARLQRAIRQPSTATISPDIAATLQRTHGNRFVSQLIASSRQAVQRFPTRTEWETDSRLTHIFGTYKRSDALQEVDEAVEDYEALQDSTDADARMKALELIASKVQAWRNSKGDVSGQKNKPSQQTKRAASIADLILEVNNEKKIVEGMRQEARGEKERREKQVTEQGIKLFVTEEIRKIKDPAARANAIFKAYMAHFRGKVQYTLKTVPDASMYNNAGTVACATIAAGLRDAFRYAGLSSKVVQIKPQSFITNPVDPSAFMDSGVTGNVRRQGSGFSSELRFFFTMHWIVFAESAGLYFDPTSGIPVSADAPEIVDTNFTNFSKTGKNDFKKDLWFLRTLGDVARSGAGYELTKGQED